MIDKFVMYAPILTGLGEAEITEAMFPLSRHGVCTLAVGYGMTFVHTKRNLFYTGTVALLAVATIYHSVYNTLVQSQHQLAGFLLPVVTFIPVFIILQF